MPNARHSRKIEMIEDTEIIETVPMRLLKSLVVKTTGASTGKTYTFSGAGSIVNVDKSDVDSIMRRNNTIRSCCGSYSSPYFEIVGR